MKWYREVNGLNPRDFLDVGPPCWWPDGRVLEVVGVEALLESPGFLLLQVNETKYSVVKKCGSSLPIGFRLWHKSTCIIIVSSEVQIPATPKMVPILNFLEKSVLRTPTWAKPSLRLDQAFDLEIQNLDKSFFYDWLPWQNAALELTWMYRNFLCRP